MLPRLVLCFSSSLVQAVKSRPHRLLSLSPPKPTIATLHQTAPAHHADATSIVTTLQLRPGCVQPRLCLQRRCRPPHHVPSASSTPSRPPVHQTQPCSAPFPTTLFLQPAEPTRVNHIPVQPLSPTRESCSSFPILRTRSRFSSSVHLL